LLTQPIEVAPAQSGVSYYGRPLVSTAKDGSFVVAWYQYSQNGPSGIFARRYSAAGTAQPSDIAVAGSAATRIAGLSCAANGSFVVAWEEGTTLKVRPYDASGSPLADARTVAENLLTYPTYHSVAALSNGTFVVVWNQAVVTSEYQFYTYGQI